MNVCSVIRRAVACKVRTELWYPVVPVSSLPPEYSWLAAGSVPGCSARLRVASAPGRWARQQGRSRALRLEAGEKGRRLAGVAARGADFGAQRRALQSSWQADMLVMKFGQSLLRALKALERRNCLFSWAGQCTLLSLQCCCHKKKERHSTRDTANGQRVYPPKHGLPVCTCPRGPGGSWDPPTRLSAYPYCGYTGR